MARILLVEDEENCVRALEYFLGEVGGHEIVTAPRAQEAIELARRRPPDVVLTDLFLANAEGGDEVVRTLVAERPDLPVIVMSGLPEPEIHKRLEDVEVFRICPKPVRLTAIRRAIDDALA
jgi:DNA-binding NtrC family response regulator